MCPGLIMYPINDKDVFFVRIKEEEENNTDFDSFDDDNDV